MGLLRAMLSGASPRPLDGGKICPFPGAPGQAIQAENFQLAGLRDIAERNSIKSSKELGWEKFMENKMRNVLILILSMFGVIACSSEKSIDQAKFEKLYRAGKTVEAYSLSDLFKDSISVERCVKELEIECSVAIPLTSSQSEREMVSHYCDAAHNFRMALSTFESGVLDLRGGARTSKEFSNASSFWGIGSDLARQASDWYTQGKISSGNGVYTVTPK
jgi:flavin-binding protein dodecin